MKSDFWEKITDRINYLDSILCVGIDPRLRREQEDDPRTALIAQSVALIERTEKFAAVYKPNIAFFEAWGLPGLEALHTIMQIIPPEIPVILDAKRGDIGSTAEAYAKSIFEYWKAGAVTLAPYMGRDSVDPFLAYPGKGVFMLARTSNPSSEEIQGVKTGSVPLYLHVAKTIASWSPRLGLVVAGNEPVALARIRKHLPDAWFLSPGIGAQGGSAEEAVAAGVRKDGLGLLANVSREISESGDPEQVAKRLRDQLNEKRPKTAALHPGVSLKKKTKGLKARIIRGLVRLGCFQEGDFTLKSGAKSPFYIDLRLAGSDVLLLKDIGRAFKVLLKDLEYDKIAALPIAALPLGTAASLEVGKPLIYPRIPPKLHGAGRPVEGVWKVGDTVVMLDDLISTGASKEEALQVLRLAGLKVESLVVLVERGRAGRFDMERLGIHLKSFMTLDEFLPVLVEDGVITEEQSQDFLLFARGEQQIPT